MALEFKLEVSGLDQVIRNLEAYRDKLVTGVPAALYEEASAIMRDSREHYVPVDTGRLKATGKVLPPEVSGTKVTVAMGYGDAAVAYAAAVHENARAGKTGGASPSGRRYKHWASVGSWKYLELPFLAAERGMLGRLADRIRNAVAGRISSEFYGGG